MGLSLEEKFMTASQFNTILDKIPSLKIVNFVGLGEPLLNPEFFSILKIAKDRNIEIVLTTNATLLNEENVFKIPENVSNITVSIDTPVSEYFRRIRGGNLQMIIKNLTNLLEKKSFINLHIQAIIMKDTLDSLVALPDLAEKIGAKSIYLLHLASLCSEHDAMHALNFPEKLRVVLKKFILQARKRGIKTQMRPLSPMLRVCSEPWVNPFLTINGDLYPCSFIYRLPQDSISEFFLGDSLEIDLKEYRLGNVIESPFEEIWLNNKMRRIRQTVRESDITKKLTLEKLRKRRKELDVNVDFNYCRVCLWRWKMSC